MGFQNVVQSGRVKVVQGRLRHRVTIVQPSLVQAASGSWDVRNDYKIAEVWASIEALTAAEKFAAHEFASVVTHKIWMRDPRSLVPQGVSANMQVWYKNRQFQIEGVLNPDERPDMLLLMTAEIDDSANQKQVVTPGGPVVPQNFDSGPIVLGTVLTAITTKSTQVNKVVITNVGSVDTIMTILQDGRGSVRAKNVMVPQGDFVSLDLGGINFPNGIYAQARDAGAINLSITGYQ